MVNLDSGKLQIAIPSDIRNKKRCVSGEKSDLIMIYNNASKLENQLKMKNSF